MPERAGHGNRDPDDYYATTPDQALRSCQTIKDRLLGFQPKTILDPTRVLEPTCGAGTWLPEIRKVWPDAHVWGIEKNPELAAFARNHGFDVEIADILAKKLRDVDLIVGNPPFKLADRIIPGLLTALRPGGALAFMLRLNFFEGQERYVRFWKVHPATKVFPCPARPGFTANGATDGTGYGLFCWVSGYDGPTTLEHMDNLGLKVRWDGRRAVKDRKTQKVIKPAKLDPAFPDPRTPRSKTHGEKTKQSRLA